MFVDLTRVLASRTRSCKNVRRHSFPFSTVFADKDPAIWAGYVFGLLFGVYLDKASQAKVLSVSNSLDNFFGHQIFVLFREALVFQVRILLQEAIDILG